ncbi:MAG: sigma-54-dependent Fis family transcriptional regulator [Candidatus Aminicenantes bacterium]|nr:sigma-54-dependent Fis family transcriptional regulator [Candidatus Aminicenantes bacterium]
MEKILIVDDEKSILELLIVVFEKEGYAVKATPSGTKAMEWLEKQDFDLVITDIKLPEISGLDILKYLQEKRPDIPIVMITAYGSIKQAVEALKAGAADYVVKPFDIEELKIIAAQALEKRRLREENIILKRELKEKYNLMNLIGKSRRMQEIYNLIEKIAGTESTVLITGESGTGKEVAARTIHALSPRKDNRFVSVNCGALPESLLESELFGHVKGAFTGAAADKKGLFEAAEQGTLFLDEIGEMSAYTQVKLLRSLQDKRIRRVGGINEIAVDVRIIAASNQDLKESIKEGKFREDLFYRLNVISMRMPPLRERREDIPLLVSHFLERHSRRMNRLKKRMTPKVMKILEAYPWPGNVRELENMMERTVAIEERQTVTEDCLPEELLHPQKAAEVDVLPDSGFDLKNHLNDISIHYIEEARRRCQGNMKKAASLLGLSYRSLRHLIEKYNLKIPREEAER